jgi:hypothetical protein
MMNTQNKDIFVHPQKRLIFSNGDFQNVVLHFLAFTARRSSQSRIKFNCLVCKRRQWVKSFFYYNDKGKVSVQLEYCLRTYIRTRCRRGIQVNDNGKWALA